MKRDDIERIASRLKRRADHAADHRRDLEKSLEALAETSLMAQAFKMRASARAKIAARIEQLKASEADYRAAEELVRAQVAELPGEKRVSFKLFAHWDAEDDAGLRASEDTIVVELGELTLGDPPDQEDFKTAIAKVIRELSGADNIQTEKEVADEAAYWEGEGRKLAAQGDA